MMSYRIIIAHLPYGSTSITRGPKGHMSCTTMEKCKMNRDSIKKYAAMARLFNHLAARKNVKTRVQFVTS